MLGRSFQLCFSCLPIVFCMLFRHLREKKEEQIPIDGFVDHAVSF